MNKFKMMSLLEYILERRGGRKPNKKEKEKIQGLGIMDKLLNNEYKTTDEENKATKSFVNIIRPNGPCIYAFTTDKVKDCIKIGYTDQHPEKRIAQWKKKYGNKEGEVTTIGYWSAEEFNKITNEKVFFWDHAVHYIVSDEMGYKNIKKEEFPKYMTDKGKQVVNLYYSSEFFEKFRTLMNGELSTDEKEILSESILECIIQEMHDAIAENRMKFKTYKFDTEGKTSTEHADDVWDSPDDYTNTDLQNNAIEKGVKAIKDNKKNLLMAAVMRFGKTHASYEIVNQCPSINKVIVTSGKADTEKAWHDDINHISFYKTFVLLEIKRDDKYKITEYDESINKLRTIERNTETTSTYTYKRRTTPINKLTDEYLTLPELIDRKVKNGKKVVLYFTLQDLGGSVSELKSKHKELFTIEYDMLIVDETHYGSHASLWGKVTKMNKPNYDELELDKDEIDENEKEDASYENDRKKLEGLNIKYKHVLQVSGTPYYILASNEMRESDAAIISKVSYTDMLKARDEWDDKNDSLPDDSPDKKNRWDSPYFGIPTLHKIGLNLTKECRDIMHDKGYEDNISKLFIIDKKSMSFVYEDAVKNLMRGVFGNDKGNTLSLLEDKTVEGNKACRHTMMVLPSINACIAMKKLLKDELKINRKVISIVGNDNGKADITTINKLNDTLQKIENKNGKSIVLTVVKFLTGVSMKMLDSMIYLKKASSPQEYDQAVFRLCTRRVKNVASSKDNEKGSPKKINMKDNVYLIDFNISNVMTMLAKSARAKALAEGKSDPEKIKEIMEEDLKHTPIYSDFDNANNILGDMHELSSDDLMRVYCDYNENMSINDIITNYVDSFNSLFSNIEFQNIMYMTSFKDDKGKLIGPKVTPGSDEYKTLGIGNKKGEIKHLSDKQKEEHRKDKDSDEYKISKEKFLSFLKSLSVFNLCIDKPYTSVDDILKDAKSDINIQKRLESFKIKYEDFKNIIENISHSYKENINQILLKIHIIISDGIKNGDVIEKFLGKIYDLGKFDKNEVITPDSVVDKMIGKLKNEDFTSANSILLVNEKCGEFFKAIYDKFGKKVAQKCRVVCSSEITLYIMKKLLKHLNMETDIDYIILNIGDVNNDGEYNVKDFLAMKNNDILDMNSVKKFDICIQNPPYSRGTDALHLQFVDKCLEISDKQVAIFPFTFVTKNDIKRQDEYKRKFDDRLTSVEEVDSSLFKGTSMPNVGIYTFSDINNATNNIKINFLHKDNIVTDSLLNISRFTQYEQNIEKIFKQLDSVNVMNLGWFMPNKYFKQRHITDKNEIYNQKLENAKKNVKNIPDNKTYLICNAFNGGVNGIYFTIKNGDIISGKNNLIDYIVSKTDISNGYNTIILNNEREAKNCKVALKNYVMRFLLYRLQQDQRMTVKKCYKYVPNIDWSDDRVKTDEGLLEVCGCPKDKCKEYADYCKKIINEVDKGNRP